MKNKIVVQRTYERPLTEKERIGGLSTSNYFHKKEGRKQPVPGYSTECPQSNPDVLSDEAENLYWHPCALDYRRGLVAEAAKDAFSVLTEKQRRVMELLAYNNLSFSQVARVLGVSKSTVRDIKEAATEKMKKYVENDLKKYPKSIFE